jgi:acetoin utilization protein AcuB
MFVRNWMSSPAVVVASTESVRTADDLMNLHKVRRLAVVEKGKLVGMMTRSDAASSGDGNKKVADVMARGPYQVAPDETLEGAAKLMHANKISGLPVVQDGHVMGVITESDVFRALVSMMGFGELGARVLMTVPDDQNLLAAIAKKVADRRLRSLVTFHDSANNRWEVMLRLSGDTEMRKAKTSLQRDRDQDR